MVYIEPSGSRWRVRVQYPGAGPHTLLSAPTRTEAERAARGYAAKHCWTFEQAEPQ